MAYSPNVQYEAYKRLDCARARSGFFFFFPFFFIFDFATLKNVFFFILFACLFSFTKLLPQRQSPVVGQNLGELSAAAWRLWQGHLGINVLPVGYSHLSAVPSLLPLQFRWSWLSGCGQPRGDARTHTLGHTRTHARAHTHARTHPRTRTHARAHSRTCTHTQSQMERTPPPLKTCGRGFR